MPTPLPPRWGLSDLFQGIDDPAIERHQAVCRRRAETFAKTYRGKVVTLSDRQLLSALKMYERLLQDAGVPETYAYLVFSVNGKNPRHGAFLQKTKEAYVAIYQTVLFFELALVEAKTSMLRRWMGSPVLKNYAHFLEELLRG